MKQVNEFWAVKFKLRGLSEFQLILHKDEDIPVAFPTRNEARNRAESLSFYNPSVIAVSTKVRVTVEEIR